MIGPSFLVGQNTGVFAQVSPELPPGPPVGGNLNARRTVLSSGVFFAFLSILRLTPAMARDFVLTAQFLKTTALAIEGLFRGNERSRTREGAVAAHSSRCKSRTTIALCALPERWGSPTT